VGEEGRLGGKPLYKTWQIQAREGNCLDFVKKTQLKKKGRGACVLNIFVFRTLPVHYSKIHY